MLIPKKTPTKKRKEKLIEKQCLFVDESGNRCKTIFFSSSRAKFCKCHRASQFRKIIDKDKIAAKKKDMIDNTANVIINHKNEEAMDVSRNCDLCGKEYFFTIYPGIIVYSKYCSDHRNQFKRELYSKENPKI